MVAGSQGNMEIHSHALLTSQRGLGRYASVGRFELSFLGLRGSGSFHQGVIGLGHAGGVSFVIGICPTCLRYGRSSGASQTTCRAALTSTRGCSTAFLAFWAAPADAVLLRYCVVQWRSYPNSTAQYPNSTAQYPNITAQWPNSAAQCPDSTAQYQHCLQETLRDVKALFDFTWKARPHTVVLRAALLPSKVTQ